MDCNKVASFISSWLYDYAAGCGAKGFVVGVSGGIDSALCSTLAAATTLPTLCVELSIHQAASHVERANEHIAWLKRNFPNVEPVCIDLSDACDEFVQAMPASDSPSCDLVRANTRSRLRMAALYYQAGLRGALVVGTGNKVEDFGVGFFTKYGDGGVDLSPIADLTKTQVYELSEMLGICRSILSAPPTDGLFGDDRSDADQIGATYPELEWAMDQYERGAKADDFDGRCREVFEIFVRRNRANRHKMEPIPVCRIPEEFLI